MNILIMLSFNLYRKNNFYISFILSLIIIILSNPFNFLNVGMWLSFMGTFGIVNFYNFFVKIVERKLNKKSKIIELFFLSLSAQIAIISNC